MSFESFIATRYLVKGRRHGFVSLIAAISIIGIAGILATKDLTKMNGGWMGYLLGKFIAGSFGFLVANIVFTAVIIIGLFIFLQFIWD